MLEWGEEAYGIAGNLASPLGGLVLKIKMRKLIIWIVVAVIVVISTNKTNAYSEQVEIVWSYKHGNYTRTVWSITEWQTSSIIHLEFLKIQWYSSDQFKTMNAETRMDFVSHAIKSEEQ